MEDVLRRSLETQGEQDRWVLEYREAITQKSEGVERLTGGDGIPEEGKG